MTHTTHEVERRCGFMAHNKKNKDDFVCETLSSTISLLCSVMKKNSKIEIGA